MKATILLIGPLVLAAITLATAAGESDSKPSTPTVTTTNASQVIAYYFHGTIRCVECLKIERRAREVIERRFNTALASKRLVFKSVNYEQPENTHFLQDYKLPCPSLVLVRQKNGKDAKWKLMGDTWKLIEDPEKFDRYFEDEVDAFLGAANGKRG
ncbi:MAG: hypothetical protein ABS95_00315 [Verrucomicrobia bacterium SCN 57-15]|nr:MAG: hypothetical protein ABS95_00315 [Verrucomicrobia bacterium SCN 57-15]